MASLNQFNGAAVTFPTTSNSIGSLRGISYDETAAEVDVTASDSTSQTFVAGIKQAELSLDLVGGSTLATASTGTEGQLDITWKDTGTIGSLTKAVLTGISVAGSMDGEITSTLMFACASTA